MQRDDEIIRLLCEIRDLLAAKPIAGQTEPARAKRSAKSGQKAQMKTGAPATGVLERLLRADRDAEEWNAIWDAGKSLDRWLAVLAVAEEEVGSETRLTAPEIAKVLDQRFRVGGAHGTNINRDLKKARRYVTRRQRGVAFEYGLTRNGLAHILQRRDSLRNQ